MEHQTISDVAVETWSPASVIGSKELSFTELAYENRKFVFNKTMVVRVTREDGGWVFQLDEPELIGFGHKQSEAESAFRQTFVACWDNIAQEDDENLTQGAINMKRTLLALAKEL
jgi:hypothetical protein